MDYRGLKPRETLPLMKETNDAVAVVGVFGVKKILMEAVVGMFDNTGIPIRACKTEQEALDWLAE